MVSLPFLLLAGALVVAASFVLAWPLRAQRGLFFGVVVAIPVLALSLYRVVGTPAGLEPAQRETPRTLADAVARLEADLERDPRQAEGWRLLGRAYREQERVGEARDAFARAAKLAPDDVGAQLEYAESRAQADPRLHFDEEATAILERILRDDPRQERARLFLGIARRQAGRNAEAAETWEPLLDRLGPEAAAGLREQIELARKDGGLAPLDRAVAEAPEAAAAGGVRIRVALDPEFAARVRLDPRASVFVIARIPDGPPMPVAAQKRSVAELPLSLTLDDGDSPMPTQKLSQLREVEILARISASGNAMPREGDIASEAVRIALPSSDTVELTLGAGD
ncbi:tetratricopeptide repeat protein [Luteimonas sp. RD2P54]|uniref:Tetratricopeptide repeat protein n=1 Tax=Luteimonas endophytica TaxID=3042023 RepID=A0ABT6J657_9GAMM|nr:tetratricopeptide repeat protein [Luteimonas endophytica]MDH5821668.1 tetratricopeptide repeat protein [Luteimonas endophytica]